MPTTGLRLTNLEYSKTQTVIIYWIERIVWFGKFRWRNGWTKWETIGAKATSRKNYIKYDKFTNLDDYNNLGSTC